MPKPRTPEVQAGGSGEFKASLWFISKFETSLAYVKPCLKKKEVKILKTTKIPDTWFLPVISATWEAETGVSLL